MKEYSETIKCDCYSHAIEVEYIADPEGIVYLNLWYLGRGNNWNLKDRIFAAWKMMTRGYMFDEILLNKEKTIRLRDALNKILED